ncbi:type III PLP-dependent enzyme [Sneathiella sp. CAU 1612]|uniref:ornithine decarboxylase n=1 Tax=Sneathiella sedimenti TaxID=2816034 RepID=A0ABS3F3T3_9PROT|nr:type III PLP-dependent enzyme [Sneathiella sedimenti]MBO0332993.1 type III PLP-dependent enzyme [Sneathiella sedimenti]
MQLLQDCEGYVADREHALAGLRRYENEATALEIEQSNDAVHFLYIDKIAEAASNFLTGFPGTCLYAAKANPHPALLRLLWAAGIRHFEVASIREIENLRRDLPMAQLYFMHPVKSRQAIARAYALGVRHFAFDSLDELRKIKQETGHAEDLSLMLRLSVSQVGAAYPLDNKFGATLMEAPLLLTHARQIAEKVGVTFHVGSQCLEVEAYVNAIYNIANMLEGCGVKIDMIDVGGGFPISYPDMEPAPLQDYFDAIAKALMECGFEDLEIFCEPGRAMVAAGGAVAVRVELRRGQSLYLNDGTYGSLFDAGQLGWTYPIELYRAGRLEVLSETSLFQLYGPTCDSIDKMQDRLSLPEDVCEGDWLIFRHLGAYGYAMQTKFNGFYSETVVAIEGGAELA